MATAEWLCREVEADVATAEWLEADVATAEWLEADVATADCLCRGVVGVGWLDIG